MNGEQVEVKREKSDELPFWRVALSVLQACFGVQSDANRQRDFGQASILPYAVAAALFTGMFVVILLFVVRLVVGN